MGWNYLLIPKLQRNTRWTSEMGELFHPTLYWTCDYLSVLGLKPMCPLTVLVLYIESLFRGEAGAGFTVAVILGVPTWEAQSSVHSAGGAAAMIQTRGLHTPRRRGRLTSCNQHPYHHQTQQQHRVRSHGCWQEGVCTPSPAVSTRS